MWTFEVIHLSDKMPNAGSRFGNRVIVIEMNFFFLERSDESFDIPVLPGAPSLCDRDLNAMAFEC